MTESLHKEPSTMIDAKTALASEVHVLEGMLGRLSPRQRVERMGLEHRLAEAKCELSKLDALPPRIVFPFTFKGKPVKRSESISAGFAGAAVCAFKEATDYFAAMLQGVTFRDSGPIPLVGRSDLQIVGTALGSFWFEFELPQEPTEVPSEQQEMYPAAQGNEPKADDFGAAVAGMLDLIEACDAADDEAALSAVSEIPPSVVAKIRAFLVVLESHEAQFSTVFGGRRHGGEGGLQRDRSHRHGGKAL